jgi:hypothetical protein
MERIQRIILMLIAVAGAPALSAQGVSGTWNATFDSDISMQKDTFVVKARRPAMLVLVQKGDSVTGTWGSAPLPTTSVRGTFDGRVLQLTTGLRESEVRVDGKPTTMKTRIDWMATVQGSRLTGTMFIRIGEREPPARRWEADRK